ncbi:MAG: hypothetical protein DRP54_02925 [Spirochaetes bacterium]|nr:MAG: hypothetical protein DRP54_02925 [Spirochaetota bacterium]
MTRELKTLMKDLDAAFFRYAHLTGALELYIMVLENTELQRAFSKVITGSKIEWKQIHRFMVLGEKTIIWYPELPVETILAQKNTLLGFLYGITLSRMIGDLDFYLSSVLKSHFGHLEMGGSTWDSFIQRTGIDLLECKHGKFIYATLQERHKIEHNKAQIDRVFLKRMAKRNVQHAYKKGDSIQKSHVDVLLTFQIIREFAEYVDTKVSELIKWKNGG